MTGVQADRLKNWKNLKLINIKDELINKLAFQA